MALEFVFSCGFDHGSVQANQDGVNEVSNGTNGTMEWQTTTKRTGIGAYHFIGGNLQGTDQKSIIEDSSDPFGGLELWIGAAWRFASFPNSGAINIQSAKPTDGATGSGTHPHFRITSAGKARIAASTGGGSDFTDSTTTLSANKWYFIITHMRNLAGDNPSDQELYIFDADTGALIERVVHSLNTSGANLAKNIALGLNISEDSTGLEFYLDDFVFVRGATNPGVCSVSPKNAASIDLDESWSATGGADEVVVLNETPPNDGDTSYAQNDTSVTTANQIRYNLDSLGLDTYTRRVLAVVANSIHRTTTAAPTYHIGVRSDSSDDLGSVGITSSFTHRYRNIVNDPATGAQWTVAAADAIKGILKDADSLSGRDIRATQAWWDVVSSLAEPISSEMRLLVTRRK